MTGGRAEGGRTRAGDASGWAPTLGERILPLEAKLRLELVHRDVELLWLEDGRLSAMAAGRWADPAAPGGGARRSGTLADTLEAIA